MIRFARRESAVGFPSGAWHSHPVILSDENRNTVELWTRIYRFSRTARN